ncbi:MAG: hypothetical protein EAZ92_03005 [Candidatus Kapaibacterium sp.]|nr:MAG: hypothetical protein EAZ92_03005 [Candidatus Kapabacteria bacterium]
MKPKNLFRPINLVHPIAVLCALVLVQSVCFAQVPPVAVPGNTDSTGMAVPVSTPTSREVPAQPASWRFGAGGGYHFSQHTVNFTRLPDLGNCCTNFNGGTGQGVSGFLSAEMPLFGNFWLGLRLGYSNLTGRITAQEPINLVGRSDNSASQGTFERRLDVNLNGLDIIPMAGFSPIENLTLHGGVQIGLVLASSYSQAEYLLTPGDGTFENNRRIRAEFSGTAITGLQRFQLAPTFGVSYELPLNPAASFTLAPEAWASLGVTPIVQGLAWTMNSLRVGASLRWLPERANNFSEREFKLRQLRDLERTIVAERSAIQSQLQQLQKSGISAKITRVVGIAENGSEIVNPTITIEQFRSSRTQPLLNFIFFDENSFVMLGRYRRLPSSERGTFSIADLSSLKPMAVYYQILNIVGKRMLDHAETTLSLLGCTAEGEETELGLRRAEAVKQYLVSTWKIAEKRITTRSHGLPDNPSDSRVASGAAENRRVELYSSSDDLLAPVRFETVLRVAEPKVLRFEIDAFAGTGIKQWQWETSQFAENQIITLRDTTGIGSVPKSIFWNLSEQQYIPRSESPVTVHLEVFDGDNVPGEAPLLSLPVKQTDIFTKERTKTGDSRIDYFDVITFPFGADKITMDEFNTKIIENAKGVLKADSKLVIYGYTDDIGDEASNRQLAERRARFIAQALGRTDAVIVGYGTSGKFDNKTPEGRFYNRYGKVEVYSSVR